MFNEDKDPLRVLYHIRADGWTVAVHNDYRLNGRHYTFWLFTKTLPCGVTVAVKGEGQADQQALAAVAAEIRRFDWDSITVRTR